MKDFNTLRVKRLLISVIDSLREVRIEVSDNDRRLASVLDQLIQEMQAFLEGFDSEKNALSFKDFISLSKIFSHLVDLVKDWFDTLSYKFSRSSMAYDKYERVKCQLVKTLNYLELMPG
jgi:hypothetical protein